MFVMYLLVEMFQCYWAILVILISCVITGAAGVGFIQLLLSYLPLADYLEYKSASLF